MKKTWKKLIALCCAASMMMTLPGSVVLADEVESPAEEISIDEAEMPAEDISIDEVELSAEEGLIDEVEMPAEEVPADEVEAPAEEIPVYEDSLSEEVVGAEGIEVGNGVTATFDEDTGAVVFTSDHGSLWNDWVDELGVDRDEILSIEVASGKVYLQGDNSEMFAGLTNLTSIDLSSFDTSGSMNMVSMFEGCSSLEELDFSSLKTSNVRKTGYMFLGCSSLSKLNLSGFNTSNVNDMEAMFADCSSLEELDLSSFDTSNVRKMGFMFSNCGSLSELNLSGFKTSNVDDMDSMFNECTSLTRLDLGRFDTANVEYMCDMFMNCSNLTELIINNFDTVNVTDMSGMFYECGSLTDIKLDSFDTLNVTDMSVMFTNCSSLRELDLSSFDTSNVTDMTNMFYGCSGLKKLDLSSFDTTNVDDASDMLYDCTDLIILETPNTNAQIIELPIEMYDEAGQAHTEIPELTESITLSITINIAECEADIDPMEFVYDGEAKKPTVTVRYENVVLNEGASYSVTYTNNINAGPATAKVTAIGHNTGEKTLTFTINKANPQLSFAEAAVSKKITDPAFTNALTKPTDVEVTFKSSNTNVASVDSTSGKVTLKGAGSATITAEASGSENYNAGSASYTLTVTAPAPTPTPKPTSGFSDVQDPKHPYYNAIYWAAEDGITKGYPDGTFGIDNNCTRGEMMMFLWRYAGKPAPKNATKSPFKDVPTNHTFFKAILWGSQKGITKGYSDGTFGINRNVTRGEAMMFLWRLKGKPAPKAAAKSPFKDVPTNHVFYKAILWGSQKKITTGYNSGVNKGKFMVNQNCSRGQIVTFLYRAK